MICLHGLPSIFCDSVPAHKGSKSFLISFTCAAIAITIALIFFLNNNNSVEILGTVQTALHMLSYFQSLSYKTYYNIFVFIYFFFKELALRFAYVCWF